MKNKILILAVVTLFVSSCKKEPGLNEVFMQKGEFEPSTITISPGATITWTNKESSTHTVSSDVGIFESGDLNKNKSFSQVFPTAGTYAYHCKYHSGMQATVIVQ